MTMQKKNLFSHELVVSCSSSFFKGSREEADPCGAPSQRLCTAPNTSLNFHSLIPWILPPCQNVTLVYGTLANSIRGKSISSESILGDLFEPGGRIGKAIPD